MPLLQNQWIFCCTQHESIKRSIPIRADWGTFLFSYSFLA
ncbi:hypothetical protein HMPREF9498_01583 [Enterococcus faecalis TX4248]|uniref:Uncharacterized protein n=1 Tax=Enterococcus faecalis TX4248 TaxID=749495 RepID=A0A125W5M1_ENTFL|nr:hypothetical protein HMPREF9515_02299 [Enterococcus faecalis TX0860]EFM82802.1 hypothetical protein HMPREF9498_01583 [Enterococcus faecalis TX4248]EPI26584.1 hypothetical protein D354_00033 [Enterococcus faecalis]